MGKRLIERITQETTIETRKLLTCNNCNHTFDVTNTTPEKIAELGWSLHKPAKRFNAVLICGGCGARLRANS